LSGLGPEDLAELVQGIDEGISSLEDRLGVTVGYLNSMLSTIDNARIAVQGTIEEHSLERMLAQGPDEPLTNNEEDAELRRREDDLINTYTQVHSLYNQLNGFVHLLTASREQFRSNAELPEIDDAKRLAIRQVTIQAQEDERRRLAREIHDGPAQVLANAIIGLEFVGRSLQVSSEGKRSSAEEIDRVKAAMREGLTEIRRFIFDLRPTMLGQRGLAATVDHYIQTYRHLFPGEIELSVADNLPHLTPDQEMTAFRVIQESMQNVHRHSRASRTWVSIFASNVGLEVGIRDNGEGFRPGTAVSTTMSGFGLVGMRERAEVIGARLAVTSEPGSGTDVQLVIPLNTRAMGASKSRRDNRQIRARGGVREPD
jgi:two-component system sensor histidine kinase DegS